MAGSSPEIRSDSQSGVEIWKVWGNHVGPIVGKVHRYLLVIDSSPPDFTGLDGFNLEISLQYLLTPLSPLYSPSC